jgi:sarcosine oxidase
MNAPIRDSSHPAAISAPYDVAVVGLGGMGSAAVAECAARGVRTVGIERFARGHAFGASNGKSRIVRQAYYEHAAYVPLLLRAYERWRALERATGTSLLELCGLLMAGHKRSDVIVGALRAAKAHGLAVRELNAGDMRTRYPTLRIGDDEVGLFEPLGGFVRPEAAVGAFLARAEDAGATLTFDAPMRSWSAGANGVTISLEDGTTVRASRLILTLGPWFGGVLAALDVPLVIQRNVQVWFASSTRAYDLGNFPVFLLDRIGLPAPLYGFPDAGDGVKAAFHGFGSATEPDTLERMVDPERDVAPLAAAMDSWMPGAAGPVRDAKACMYALTPDADFVVDRHPLHDNVILCGGFSGHGFKFASVVGEIAADLALLGRSRLDIDFLSLGRFSHGGTPASPRNAKE